MPNSHAASKNTERKAFVLLSGGLDSTTCLHKAIIDYEPYKGAAVKVLDDQSLACDWVEAISINYGQRHIKEAEYAKKTCDKFGIQHTVLNLANILGGAMLTDGSIEIPNVSYNDLPQGVSPTYVPFRNGTLLSLITAHAQKWVNAWKPEDDMEVVHNLRGREAGIYFGAHSEDAANWAYPDCTPEFIGAMANAIYIGSYQQIRLHTPLQWLMKDEIITLGDSLGVDFANTWSCYKGEERHCGVCPTCRSRRDAFVAAEVTDPTEYANDVPFQASASDCA